MPPLPTRFMRAAFCVLIYALPLAASAWSAEGHRLVADLAEDALSPNVRAEVQALLGDEPAPSLGAIASWADDMRERPEWEFTAPHHYVRIHDPACHYVARRDCPEGDCVVGAIQRHRITLADRNAGRRERAEALKFLVHFVGDAHQPLHCGHRDDRGGNRFQVSLDRGGTNLHALWDHDLIDSAGLDHAQWLRRLEPLPPATDVDAPERWAEQSCGHTNDDGFYPRRPGRLPEGYLERHRPLAEMRLRLAAARLAAVLEGAFAPR